LKGRRRRIRMALGATLLGVVGQAVPGLACGYHGGLGGGLAPAHPRSIEVAIAVRDALDRQVIEAPPRLPALTQFARIGRWLEQVRQRLAVAGDPEPPLPPIALVLIESRLWARYSPHDGKVALAPHVEGPTTGDVVVLTGEPVLKGLLDGSISVERAIAEGILVVSGSSTSDARVEERCVARSTDRQARPPPRTRSFINARWQTGPPVATSWPAPASPAPQPRRPCRRAAGRQLRPAAGRSAARRGRTGASGHPRPGRSPRS